MNTPHNVLGMATKTVYLTDPMNKLPDATDNTEPQEPAGPGEPTSAPTNKEEETWKKRYADLKSYHDKTSNEKDARINDLTSKAADKELTTPKFPKTPEEYKEFREKYPELAANMETAALMAIDSKSQALQTKMKQLEDVQASIRAREGIAELKQYHPDFEQIKDDPRFIDWYERQLSEIQGLINSSNPKVIAEGLNKYKQDLGIKTKGEDKKNLTREVNVPQRVQIGEGQKRIYSDSIVHKMKDAEFEKLQPDIKLAMQEGRYLFGQ